MTANVVRRVWEWRAFVWAGVIGSIVGWAWTWFLAGGATAFMLLVAIASAVLAVRATSGMRVAQAGLMVAGLVMFLASLYWTAQLLLQAPNVSVFAVVSTGVFPMVAAILLLLGSVAAFRRPPVSEAPAS